MSEPLRIGVMGCARIARRRMLPALAESPDVQTVAIASQRPRVASKWAEEFSIPHSYDSYDAMLSDERVKAVYIPASGEQHQRLTLAAAAAGKHVLCEKPLATSVAAAEEMVAACSDAGVVLQEAFMWRHHPRTKRTRALIDAGAIGELRLINVSFSFPLDPGDWRMQTERGGGAMWDLGCYGVDAARLFTSAEPDDIYARGRFAKTGVDLSMQTALRFPKGRLANIDCSFETIWRSRLELVGTTGRIEWPTAFQHWDPTIRLYRSSDWEAEPEIVTCEDVSQFTCQVRAFVQSVRAGKLQAPAEDGLANMRVLDEVYHQARES